MQNKKVIIWDLDNTLYVETDEFKDMLDEATALALVKDLGLKMDVQTAKAMVKESYKEYRNGGEIFVFDMGTPVKIADLARRMIELAGLVPDKDIEIAYTGLRPGEKLYEELLATKENTLPTENKKIFRAKVREYDYREVDRQIDALTELAIQVDKTGTVRKMKEIVPEFKSKNSVYEELDVKQPSPTPALGKTVQSEKEQGDKTAEVRGNITTTGKEFS